MMGRTHAASGAAVWLTGCAVVDVGAATTLIGALLATMAALGPDIDHPNSTATRSLGQLPHRLVKRLAIKVYAATRTSQDDPVTDGHRGLTHTLVCAVVVGVLAGIVAHTLIGWWWGGAATVVGCAVTIGWAVGAAGDALTRRGVPLLWPLRIRGRRWWDVCPPRRLRIRTNGVVERFLLYPGALVATVVGLIAVAVA